tara:strand:+ start:111 stop:782 length:672 start_codon:yes stop_codon:yes gene_type:complete
MNIILDFDGVFVHSNFEKEKCLIEAICSILGINKLNVSKFITKNPGMNRETYFEYFLDLHNQDEESFHKTMDLLKKTYAQNVKEIYHKCLPNPYILKLLKKEMFDFYIISSGNKNEIKNFLNVNRINNIKGVYGGPKTKVENLMIMISEKKIIKNETIIIGDGNKDFELAYKSEMKCILVGEWSLEANNLQNLSANKKNVIYTAKFKNIQLELKKLLTNNNIY